MRIRTFSIFLIFITVLALLYVHQQVQILKIGYSIEVSEREFSSLLDQNRALVYNIARLKSPVHLEERFLADKKDFRISKLSQTVEIVTETPADKEVVIAKTQKRPVGILRIFGRPREAMAKTVK